MTTPTLEALEARARALNTCGHSCEKCWRQHELERVVLDVVLCLRARAQSPAEGVKRRCTHEGIGERGCPVCDPHVFAAPPAEEKCPDCGGTGRAKTSEEKPCGSRYRSSGRDWDCPLADGHAGVCQKPASAPSPPLDVAGLVRVERRGINWSCRLNGVEIWADDIESVAQAVAQRLRRALAAAEKETT